VEASVSAPLGRVAFLVFKLFYQFEDSRLICCLQGHGYEVFVLEHNPVDKRILLSAGHDGQIMIWDIVTGVQIKTFYNAVCVFCCFY